MDAKREGVSGSCRAYWVSPVSPDLMTVHRSDPSMFRFGVCYLRQMVSRTRRIDCVFCSVNSWLVLMQALVIKDKIDVNYQSSLKCYWAPSTFGLSQPENLNLNFLDMKGSQCRHCSLGFMLVRRISIVVSLCSITENLQPLLGFG